MNTITSIRATTEPGFWVICMENKEKSSGSLMVVNTGFILEELLK